ncbi:nucleotidyltransferase domain-containing protein [Candidatus Woesearchaeota archaeon]|nr:nucleotidyltransferase domain-containing protein [Candidatus Woesearchaeota archaeon]
MKPIVTKKYQKLLIQSSRQKVLEVFFRYPEKEFSLSDLAKEAGVAKPHIGVILKEMEQFGLIIITKLTKIWRIRANQQNERFVKNKIIYNLNFIYQSGIIKFLDEYYNHPKLISLFGSFRKGEDFSTSDIDIAIEDDVKEYEIVGLRELLEFEKSIKRRIQINRISRRVFKSLKE